MEQDAQPSTIPKEHEWERIRKAQANHAVRAAKVRGDLVPEPCETCGKEPADAHHDDYGKPLDVRWLCRRHHSRHHAGHIW